MALDANSLTRSTEGLLNKINDLSEKVDEFKINDLIDALKAFNFDGSSPKDIEDTIKLATTVDTQYSSIRTTRSNIISKIYTAIDNYISEISSIYKEYAKLREAREDNVTLTSDLTDVNVGWTHFIWDGINLVTEENNTIYPRNIYSLFSSEGYVKFVINLTTLVKYVRTIEDATKEFDAVGIELAKDLRDRDTYEKEEKWIIAIKEGVPFLETEGKSIDDSVPILFSIYNGLTAFVKDIVALDLLKKKYGDLDFKVAVIGEDAYKPED
jgi:uncharacterized protein YoxC